MKHRITAALERFSRAMLAPLSYLSAAGLLLVVGALLTSAPLAGVLPFLRWEPVQLAGRIIYKCLTAVISNLSVLFCTGLAAALAKREKHQAAFIALMSYLVYLTAGNVTLTELGLLAQPDALTGLYSAGQTMVLGIQTVDTGVFGGILLGIGVGLVIKGGACLDGTELLAMLCSKRLPVSVGQVILFLNLVIFSVAACLFGIDRALLSLLTYIIASKLIDMVETGFNEAKQTIIICNDGATIATEIYEKLGRTMTILDAHGLISGKKDMMYCVITRLELMELRRIVEKYDGSAFITVSDISEIIGDHIKKTSKVQQEVIAQQMERREKAFAESEE